MNVIFVEPAFPKNQREFVRGLASVGASVIGIGERPGDWLDDELRGWLSHYQQVGSVTDTGALSDAVRWVQDKVYVDRLEATVEAHIMSTAKVREACGISGTSLRTAYLCRDKPTMKEVLRDAGVPCAASTAAHNAAEVYEFVDRVGFPLILKPRAAAGAAGTVRVDNADELDSALAQFGGSGTDSIAVEEFIEGHEGFYDTVAIDGQVAHDFASHYFPNVLDAMRDRWVAPEFIATNRIDSAPAYREVKEMGQRVIEALGIGTSATHMEWFYGDRGLKFSEIGCRPPGVGAWDLYAAGNDMDIYREWAHAVVHGAPAQKPSRRFSAGIVALRPDRDGQISGYTGVDGVNHAYGQWILDAHLPPAGTPTQPVEAGYMANAYVRMRHPDYDELHRMLDDVGRTLRVHAA
ncbi:MAG: acetyl-CoA carboxylase biotin carboxylase subunit family protein [Mycobacteriales bacterium]|nr:ATP-grasp domain-containing protein [Frankia sp.]